MDKLQRRDVTSVGVNYAVSLMPASRRLIP